MSGISLRERLGLALLGPRGLKRLGERNPFVAAAQSGRPIFTDWSTSQAILHGLKASVWVYACVRRLSSQASSIPWLAEARLPDGTWERVPNHPIEQLLEDANPYMSGQDLFERTCHHLNLGGNALWHIILAGNPPMPVELWPLSPDQAKPVPHSTEWVERYDYTVGTRKIKLDPQEVLHFQFVDPSNPYWGMSPLQAAARVVDTDVEAVRWNKLALQNRAVTDGLFSFATPISKEQWEELRDLIREQHQGADVAHDPWILGYGADFKPMSLSPVEMDWLESRKFHVAEICAVYGVPVVLLSAERTTYNNMRTAKRMMWEDTIVPYLDDLQAALNLGLVPFWDPQAGRNRSQAKLRVVYDVSNVTALQEALLDKVKAAKLLSEMGVPINQINQRLELGFDDIPGGDEPRPMGGGPGAGKAAAGWDEKHRAAHWKSFDGDRQRWEKEIAGVIVDRFETESEEVVAAYLESGRLSALNAVDIGEEAWRSLLEAAHAAVIEHFGQLELLRLIHETRAERKQLPDRFDPNRETISQFIARHTTQRVKKMAETTKRHLATAIGAGMEEGETSTQIAARLREVYVLWASPPADSLIDVPRSMLIARTEVGTAANYGHYEGAKQTGLPLTKEWLTSRDDRVRDSHAALEGQTVKMDERFSNGMLYPNDPGASAAEVCNCRCTFANRVEETEE